MNLDQTASRDYIKSHLEQLKNANVNTIYADNEGELVNGLINIALESNDYWGTYGTPISVSSYDKLQTNDVKINLIDGGKPKVGIPNVQVDCAGYIIGWFLAVQQDIAHGTLTKDRTWDIIEKGFQYGATFSGLEFLVKK